MYYQRTPRRKRKPQNNPRKRSKKTSVVSFSPAVRDSISSDLGKKYLNDVYSLLDLNYRKSMKSAQGFGRIVKIYVPHKVRRGRPKLVTKVQVEWFCRARYSRKRTKDFTLTPDFISKLTPCSKTPSEAVFHIIYNSGSAISLHEPVCRLIGDLVAPATFPEINIHIGKIGFQHVQCLNVDYGFGPQNIVYKKENCTLTFESPHIVFQPDSFPLLWKIEPFVHSHVTQLVKLVDECGDDNIAATKERFTAIGYETPPDMMSTALIYSAWDSSAHRFWYDLKTFTKIHDGLEGPHVDNFPKIRGGSTIYKNYMTEITKNTPQTLTINLATPSSGLRLYN